MNDVTAARPAMGANASPHERLRAAARQLEGVFVTQLLKAMRESSRQGGLASDSSGEQLFTDLFDERMAQEAALRSRNGIGEAIYRQMARRIPADTPVPTDPESR